MSEGKVAAQVAHAVKNLARTPEAMKEDLLEFTECSLIVLGVSDKKFKELVSAHRCCVQIDKGLTEVAPGTRTAAAWLER